jgi:putative transcriptional regulator
LAIVVTLDIMLAARKVRSRELAAAVGITEQNLSLLKSGKVRGLRFGTLAAICAHLQCQPGDILKYVDDGAEKGDERAFMHMDPAADAPD